MSKFRERPNTHQAKRQVETSIPTPYGSFTLIAYAQDENEYSPQLAFVSQSFTPEEIVWVRVHSECITGDVFGSKRCDCGSQLDAALQKLAVTNGVLIYLRQEGRGIGLINKLKAYNLQDKGLNTQDANIHLGFEPDERTYEQAIQILYDLGVERIILLTNNPQKIEWIEKSDKIDLVRREPLIIKAHKENKAYLETKRDVMGHLLRDI